MLKMKEEVQAIVLKDGHTHAGKPRKKDDIITVSPADLAWGIKHEVLAKAPAAKKEG